MKSIELKGKCQGEQHRIFISLNNDKLCVECPDHDFDLDDVELAFGVAPRARNYCSGIYYAWHGIVGVSLDQVNICLTNARTHGLTSKVAKKIFGPDISKLFYEGVRSFDFAKELIRYRVYPSNAPFDPVAAENFVLNHRESFISNFAELALAGGSKLNDADVEWVRENDLSLIYVIKKLQAPDVWWQLEPTLDRDKLNNWWRTLRKHYIDASGELILTFINKYPVPLKGIEFVTLEELEDLLIINNPELQRVLYRLLVSFRIDDLPSLLAAHKKGWSINDLNTTPERDILNELNLARKAYVSSVR